MGEILVDCKVEVKGSSLVHSFVGLDRKRKVEDIVRVRERRPHGFAKGAFKFRQIWGTERGQREV